MDNNVFIMSDKLARLKEVKEMMERDLKDVKATIEQVESELVEVMVNEEISSFKRNDKTFYLVTKKHASIRADQKDEAIEWFKESPEYCDLVKETINAQTLAAWVRERDEDGGVPEELEPMLNIFEKTTISVRR